MKKSMLMFCVVAAALAVCLTGCSKEVEHSASSSVSTDGTVKTQEKTVTKAPDGTVTTTKEESKTTTKP